MTESHSMLLEGHVTDRTNAVNSALDKLERLDRDQLNAVLRSIKVNTRAPIERYVAKYRRDLAATYRWGESIGK